MYTNRILACSNIWKSFKNISGYFEANGRLYIVPDIVGDLSKAFDCVSHRLLNKKLCQYGIRGTTLILLELYLSLRDQCVSLGDEVSDFGLIESDTSQFACKIQKKIVLN